MPSQRKEKLIEACYYFHSVRAIAKKLVAVRSAETAFADEHFFDTVFEKYEDSVLFVHAGLSKIRSSFSCQNPYSYLIGKLGNHFKTILAPGFTPSFRKSGIYHKNFSLPEYGAFSRLFLTDANYRTNDAIHSICCKGVFDFSNCNHQDSFGRESCFYELVRQNVLFANIGTNDFVCTLLHCIERICAVPYVADDFVKGEVYVDNENHKTVTQWNYAPRIKYVWDRKKIVHDLKRENIIRDFSKGGLLLYFFHAKDLFDFISAKVSRNPYYLLLGGGQ